MCVAVVASYRRYRSSHWLYDNPQRFEDQNILNVPNANILYTGSSLLVSGGAIPANKYKSSTYVGLRHPVIARHALFGSGSNMSAYLDLAHTGTAYSSIG